MLLSILLFASLAFGVSVFDRREDHHECLECAKNMVPNVREKISDAAESVSTSFWEHMPNAPHMPSMPHLPHRSDIKSQARHHLPQHWWNWPFSNLFHGFSGLTTYRPRVDIEVRVFSLQFRCFPTFPRFGRVFRKHDFFFLSA
jgi:hypothetical protein